MRKQTTKSLSALFYELGVEKECTNLWMYQAQRFYFLYDDEANSLTISDECDLIDILSLDNLSFSDGFDVAALTLKKFITLLNAEQDFNTQKVRLLLKEARLCGIQQSKAKKRGEESYQRVKQYLNKHWVKGQPMSSCDEKMLNDKETNLKERQIITHRQRYFKELKAAK